MACVPLVRILSAVSRTRPAAARTPRRVRTARCAAVLLAVAATGAVANAQVVHLANLSPTPYVGWKRCTVDTQPPHAAGLIGDTVYRVGRKIGLDTWIVDLHVGLQGGERRSVDLATGVPLPLWPVPVPSNPIAHFGGVLKIDTTPIAMDAPVVDGAAVTMRGTVRLSPMLHAEVWLRWYPSQPGLVYGEATGLGSNGAVPDVQATVPAGGLRLVWGDGMPLVHGAGWGAPLVPGGTVFADGQGRTLPFVILWPRHCTTSHHWVQAAAAVHFTVGAVGITRLWPGGNPSYPPGFDPVAWAGARFQGSLLRLHTWDPGVIGPNPISSETGAQGDQVFVGGESLLPNGAGAEVVTYLGALKLTARPCHHLEANGRQADPAAHPNCVFWSGRPHWHLGVSPDQLGKTAAVTADDANGWFGPDREHWLYNTVAAAARITGSPALQRELEQQARIFLFSETVVPGWSTSGADAARSIGWAGLLVVHLWRNLEDRGLAQRVAQRWQQRVTQVYVPQLGNLPYDVWDVRIDDPRLGPGAMWMAWQQSIGSYGLDLACEVLNVPAGRALALKAAKACLQHNWILQGGRYHGVGNIRFPPPAPSFYNGVTWPEAWFETTWDLPAVQVVLRHEPNHAKALAVWAQAIGDLGGLPRSWVPPGS